MELYELIFHFPCSYASLENQELTLTTVDYYPSDEAAIHRAKTIANALVTPRPDYFYVAGMGGKVWTNNIEETKKALHYDLLCNKPIIKTIEDDDVYPGWVKATDCQSENDE